MRLSIFILAFVALNLAIFATAAPSNQATNVRVARKLHESENAVNFDRRDVNAMDTKNERDEVEVNYAPLIREVAKDGDNDLVSRENKIAVYFWFEWCDITGNDCVGHINLLDNFFCFFKPFDKKTIRIHRSGYFVFYSFELSVAPFGLPCPADIPFKAQKLFNPFDGQVIKLEHSDETRFSVKKL